MEFSTSYPTIPSPSGLTIEPSSSTVSYSKKWASVPVLTADQGLQLLRLELGQEDDNDVDNDDVDHKDRRRDRRRPVRKFSSSSSSNEPASPPASPVPSRKIPPEKDNLSVQQQQQQQQQHGNSAKSEELKFSLLLDQGIHELEEKLSGKCKGLKESQSSHPCADTCEKVEAADVCFTNPFVQLSPEDGVKCDLIAQLDGSGEGKSDAEAVMMSSFDDNGNPLDLQGDNNKDKLMDGDGGGGEGRDILKTTERRRLTEPESPNANPLEEPAKGAGSRKGSKEDSQLTDSHDGGEPGTILLGFKSHLQHSVEGFLEEPKYFINAAALSEDLDTFTMPSLESIGTTDGSNDVTHVSSPNNQTMTRNYSRENNSSNREANECVTPTNPSSDAPQRDKVPTNVVKPRVPMSKSFPDIIQTTFVDDCREFKGGKKMFKAETVIEKEPSVNDLTADSLEDLPAESIGHPTTTRPPHQRDSGIPYDLKMDNCNFQDIMSMSQSQSQIGILAEKPPEAWVIDLNSLSLDSEAFDNSEMSSSIKSSNPSSLAYFIDMDERCPELQQQQQQQQQQHKKSALKSPEKKKIFSMFVDFGEAERSKPPQYQQQQQQEQQQLQQQQQHQHAAQPSMKPSRLPVHRNVMNVLKEGEPVMNMMMMGNPNNPTLASTAKVTPNQYPHKKRAYQYPSPISQHKVAVQASSRKAAAKIELLEATEKAKELREEPPIPPEPAMEASTTSNRSSLHVATEFDMTFSSSFISSMETSAPEAEELCSKGPCFKLGKDLLRMFQDGINTDVNISVNGRYLKAHKCILSSRSQYFAAIFSGQLLEKAGNTIELDGFSYTVVHFAMCHIYSGTNEIPDSIDLLELATLTDLLGLEGLRENISQTIRVKFCHNFHRPCTGCISGVLECLPIALSYEMDELHRKMTKWICKHFVRIWPTKAFANLGDELIDKCLRYSVNHLSVDNILDITLGCDQLLTTMPTVRWTEPIFVVVNQLSKACVLFIGENFSQVLQSQRFLMFGKGQQWNISRIEGTFMEAMTLLKPDEACLSHTALSRLIELGTETIDEVEWSTMFVDFLRVLAKDVERYLIGNASKAVLSKYWETLGKDVQKRICTSSFLGYDKAGNKIVKGSTPAMAAKQPSQGRLTPSERTSSISSIKSTSSKSHTRNRDENKGGFSNQGSNYSNSGGSNAKIASVRPIQNVFSTAGSDGSTTQSSTMPKSNAGSSGKQSSHRPQPTQLTRRKTEEKEKSFSNSPRNSIASSSIASANRTPLNPLTPMTPNKPGPGMLGATTAPVKGSSRQSQARNANNPANNTNNAAPATKPGFITNSARANLVSKPNLRQRNVSSTSTRSTTPRTPNLSQPSRYASSLGISRNNRHSQGSGSDKSERASSGGTPNDSSKLRTNRASTISGMSARESRDKSTHKNSTASGSSSSSSRKTSAKTRTSSSGGAPDPMRDSNIMSKSTIEMDSGETKIRTLAEIGRSSTFSKDEPTILGKLDPNQTVNIDFS